MQNLDDKRSGERFAVEGKWIDWAGEVGGGEGVVGDKKTLVMNVGVAPPGESSPLCNIGITLARV